MSRGRIFTVFVVWLLLHVADARRSAASRSCQREPQGVQSRKRLGDNGFHIDIKQVHADESTTQPQGYIPGQSYLLTLSGHSTEYTVQTFRAFTLVAMNQRHEASGKFMIDSIAETAVTFSTACPYAVEQSNFVPKTQVTVVWHADAKEDGCVDIKAAVLEYADSWYMDDGRLTQQFCPLPGYERLVPDDSAAECCACDEAKYELVLDGIWSRRTHPKDFPTLVHLTHFSDLIGASHSNKYSEWALGEYASDGLKELAEWGNTQKMESEMKDRASEIRTIVKARGLWYPDVTGTTKSSFRVDKYHHLFSLGAMLGPSPDWVVGVSKINLCLPDCTWAIERTFDLTPWDAGTDSGASYESPNNPSQPRERIRKITSSDDVRSPFFDPDGNDIPPVARLTLRKKQDYKMECKSVEEYKQAAVEAATTSEDEEYADRRECMVAEWTPWSLCSATCGKGIRMRSRVYKFPVKAQMFNCERQVTEKQFCNARISVCEESETFNEQCATNQWGDWTTCSVTCGIGARSRTRQFIDSTAQCPSVELAESEQCEGERGPDCSVTPNPLCRTTSWSDWSPCSASCGKGMRVRTRLFYYAENSELCHTTELMQEENCKQHECTAFFEHYGPEICAEEKVTGQCSGIFAKYWYNKETNACERFIYTGCKGNHNRFDTEQQCQSTCVEGYQPEESGVVPGNALAAELGLVDEHHSGSMTQVIHDGGEDVDCMVTEWSPWESCSSTCGDGWRSRTRHVKVLPRNDGRQCPTDLKQRFRCHMRPCPIEHGNRLCTMSKWHEWSSCSESCGIGHQTRTRDVTAGTCQAIDTHQIQRCMLQRQCPDDF